MNQGISKQFAYRNSRIHWLIFSKRTINRLPRKLFLNVFYDSLERNGITHPALLLMVSSCVILTCIPNDP